jgi:hypothetical protein
MSRGTTSTLWEPEAKACWVVPSRRSRAATCDHDSVRDKIYFPRDIRWKEESTVSSPSSSATTCKSWYFSRPSECYNRFSSRNAISSANPYTSFKPFICGSKSKNWRGSIVGEIIVLKHQELESITICGQGLPSLSSSPVSSAVLEETVFL